MAVASGGVTVEVFLTRPAKSFNTVAVSGQSDVVAETPNKNLTFIAGTNITITTDPLNDEITFNSSAVGGNVDGGTVI